MDEDFSHTNKVLHITYSIFFIGILLIIYLSYSNFFFKNNYVYDDYLEVKLFVDDSFINSNGTVIFKASKYEFYDYNIRNVLQGISKLEFNNKNISCNLINDSVIQTQVKSNAIKYTITSIFYCTGLKQYKIYNGTYTLFELETLYERKPKYYPNPVEFQFKAE